MALGAGRLLIDGDDWGGVDFNQPAPGACQSIGNVPGCPNIGFQVSFDTRRLRNGPHTLGVRVSDGSLSATLPGQVPGGMNVVVLNP